MENTLDFEYLLQKENEIDALMERTKNLSHLLDDDIEDSSISSSFQRKKDRPSIDSSISEVRRISKSVLSKDIYPKHKKKTKKEKSLKRSHSSRSKGPSERQHEKKRVSFSNSNIVSNPSLKIPYSTISYDLKLQKENRKGRVKENDYTRINKILKKKRTKSPKFKFKPKEKKFPKFEKSFHELSVEISPKMSEEYRKELVVDRYRYGLLHYEKQSFEKALAFFTKSLTYYSQLGMEDLGFLCNIFIGIGNCYYCTGNYEMATESFERIIEVLGKVQKPDRYYSLISPYMNLGLVHLKLGNHENSMSFFLMALKMSENVLGVDRLVVADIYHNLGVVFDEKGNCLNALKMYKKSLSIRKRIFGVNHPLCALTMENIALILKDIKKYRDALKLQKEVLEIRKKNIGMNNLDYALGCHNMAIILFKMKNFAKALFYINTAYEMRRKMIGKASSLTKQSFSLRKKILKHKSKLF